MKRKLKIFISALFVVLIVFAVMFLFEEGKKREVKNLVIAYNTLITKAHLEMNAGLMKRLTSDWQIKKIDSYIAYNLKNKRIIKGELKDFEFKDVDIEDDLATIITTERWLWMYVDPATKNPISELFDELYGNTYHLKKVEGLWVVDDLESNFIGKAED